MILQRKVIKLRIGERLYRITEIIEDITTPIETIDLTEDETIDSTENEEITNQSSATATNSTMNEATRTSNSVSSDQIHSNFRETTTPTYIPTRNTQSPGQFYQRVIFVHNDSPPPPDYTPMESSSPVGRQNVHE